MMGLQPVHTDTIPIIHTLAHPTGTTVRSGLTADCLSALVRGITGVGTMIDIGVVVEIGIIVDIGVMGTTGARDGVMVMTEGMDAAIPVTMLEADTDTAIPVTMLEAGTDTAIPVTMLEAGTDTVTHVADSTAVKRFAAADFTVEAEVAFMAEVDSTGVADMVADAGKQL